MIFDLVYTLACCRKPVERLWISSLTREAILAGFRNLQPAAAYRGLRDSARCRQQADWLVGLNATRAQTLRARQAGADGVYSLGRVQTPTLALIVARDQEIAAFVPVEYYEVVATFQASAGSYNGLWGNAQGSRLTTRPAADAITAKVQGRRGTVVKVEKQARQERPPLLYDLTSLQQAANARYAFCSAHAHPGSIPLRKDLHHLPAHRVAPSLQQRQPGTAGLCRGRQRRPVSSLYLHDPGLGSVSLTSRHVDDTKVTDHHAIIPATQRVDPAASPTRSACTTSSPAASSPLFTRTPSSNARRSVPRSRASALPPVVLSCWRLAGRRLTRPGAQGRLPTMPQRRSKPFHLSGCKTRLRPARPRRSPSTPRPRHVILTRPCSGPWRQLGR